MLLRYRRPPRRRTERLLAERDARRADRRETRRALRLADAGRLAGRDTGRVRFEEELRVLGRGIVVGFCVLRSVHWKKKGGVESSRHSPHQNGCVMWVVCLPSPNMAAARTHAQYLLDLADARQRDDPRAHSRVCGHFRSACRNTRRSNMAFIALTNRRGIRKKSLHV